MGSKGAKPTHYDLQIEPDLEAGTFKGKVAINIVTLAEISSITINAHGLEIQETTIQGVGILKEKSIAISGTEIDSALQTFTIFLAESVPAKSKLLIRQSFSASLNRYGEGFHITEVPLPPSNSTFIASTLMEPREARTVFPCFDEPILKSKFSVTLIVDQHLCCLGNMPIKIASETVPTAAAKKVVEFEDTPMMSTYILAFAIGEFDMIETNEFRVPIRAYAPIGYDMEHCRYALGMSAKALSIYEIIFGIDYPLPKLDLVAIPGNTEGMENWGLITLPVSILLIAPDSPAADKTASAQMILHEIAHQWIGNLVTMDSWEGFWLKEGFSDWAELYVQDQMAEGSESWENFVSDGYQLALLLDSNRASHPLDVSLDREGDINHNFDIITYKKGCAVLRMVANYLGEEVFLRGVRHYLRQHAFGNTQTEDFWMSLNFVSGTDIACMMRTWANNVGYPVLNVAEDESSGTITVTQNRFLVTRAVTAAEDSIIYPIFLGIKIGSETIQESLHQRSKTIKLPLNFYKINPDQTSFYRVAYSPARLRRFGTDMEKGLLSVTDRVGIISDAAALAFAGHPAVRTSDLLSLLQNFEDEKSFFVWKMILTTLGEISRYLIFAEEIFCDAVEQFQKHLVRKVVGLKANFAEDDSINEQRFKALIFSSSGYDRTDVEASFMMFNRFISGDEKAINANIRSKVFKRVLKAGGIKTYDKLTSRLKIAGRAERRDILESLGHARSAACIKRTLERALSPDSILRTEVWITISGLTTHKKGIHYLWGFLRSEVWMNIPDMNLRKVAPIILYILDSFTTMKQYEDVKQFFEDKDTSGFGSALDQCLESIQARASWFERDREDLLNWLKMNKYYNGRHLDGLKYSIMEIWKTVLCRHSPRKMNKSG